MEENNRQETLKSLGQIEDEIMKTRALFFGEELLNEADLEKIKEKMKMTKRGEMLRADFIEEGRAEGRAEEEAKHKEYIARYNRLVLCLDKDGKTALIVKAATDPEFLEELFKEYNL